MKIMPPALLNSEHVTRPPSGRRATFVQFAFQLSAVIERYIAHARRVYYAIVLSGHACPCCAGPLVMLRDGHCRCRSCQQELDPTLAFQECPQCGAAPRLRVSRYAYSRCGGDIPSRFLFDGRVFDSAYFRAKMAEHRQRRAAQRQRIQQMLAGTRSSDLLPGPADLDAVPGLAAALDQLTRQFGPVSAALEREAFDLARYEEHVRSYVGTLAISLTEIPPAHEDPRRDLIWRFVAVVFLAHAGLVHVWQERNTIWVRQREAD